MIEVTNVEDNVDLVKIDGKSLYIVGTAHVSQSSADLAEKIIRDVSPESVAVELCDSRYQSLKNPDRWKNTDLVSIIRSGKSYVLMAQLILAGFQKKLGNQLQTKPGAEMMRAIQVAEDVNAKTVLADRDVGITLKRTWASMSFWSICKVFGGMLAGLFSNETIDENEIERLKSADALEELMKEFSESFPKVQESLIFERDRFLAQKIQEAPGNSVVAIVGAGHVPGILKLLGSEIETDSISKIPPPRKLGKVIGWGIPIIVLSMIVYGFYASGAATSVSMIESWFWINGILGALGATVAFGHPLTILSAFIASPFTSLNPLIAGGWVAGLVEAIIRKPTVSDLETIADDVSTVRGVWKNRVSRVLLVVALTNLFGSLGTFIGAGKIASQL